MDEGRRFREECSEEEEEAKEVERRSVEVDVGEPDAEEERSGLLRPTRWKRQR